jgi:hypothetical protein
MRREGALEYWLDLACLVKKLVGGTPTRVGVGRFEILALFRCLGAKSLLVERISKDGWHD